MKQVLLLLLLFPCYQMIASDFLSKENQANAYYDQSGLQYKKDSLQESLSNAYQALDLFQELGNQEMVTKCAFRIYQNHYKSQNFELALESANRCVELSHDEDWKHLSIYNKGLAFLRLAHYDSALASFDGTYQYFLKEGNERWICNSINQKALTYYYVGSFDKARVHYQDLLDLSLEKGNDKFAGNALNNIGNSYLKEGLIDSARVFLLEALKYQTNDRDRLSTYLNLAKVAEEPVPFLIKARSLYQNELEINEYVDILHQLTIHHTNQDSVAAFTTELAQIAVTSADQYKQISSISKQLEVQHMETLLELQKAEKAKKRNLLIFLFIFILTVLAAIGIIYFFRKRWLPEWAQYKIELMAYQIKELQKTIRQFRDC